MLMSKSQLLHFMAVFPGWSLWRKWHEFSDYWSQILYIFMVDSRLHWWKFHGSDEIGFSPTFLTLKIFFLCVIIKGYLMFGVRIVSLLKAVVSWFIIVTCIKKCQGR